MISVSDEDMETVQKFLDRPYTEGGEEGPATFRELTSAYCLTTDPDRSTAQAYMAAAMQNGIPACFLVGKTGVVEWIGHPMRLDEPLSKVIDGTWDRDAFGDVFKKSQLFDLAMQQIFEAAQAGDMEKAQTVIATLKKVASDPRQAMQVQHIELQLKLAPIAEKLRDGDLESAITDLEVVLAEAEGPMKQQVAQILDRVKEQLAANEEEGNDTEEEETAEEN